MSFSVQQIKEGKLGTDSSQSTLPTIIYQGGQPVLTLDHHGNISFQTRLSGLFTINGEVVATQNWANSRFIPLTENNNIFYLNRASQTINPSLTSWTFDGLNKSRILGLASLFSREGTFGTITTDQIQLTETYVGSTILRTTSSLPPLVRGTEYESVAPFNIMTLRIAPQAIQYVLVSTNSPYATDSTEPRINNTKFTVWYYKGSYAYAPSNASPSQIEAALQTIPTIGAGNVTVTLVSGTYTTPTNSSDPGYSNGSILKIALSGRALDGAIDRVVALGAVYNHHPSDREGRPSIFYFPLLSTEGGFRIKHNSDTTNVYSTQPLIPYNATFEAIAQWLRNYFTALGATHVSSIRNATTPKSTNPQGIAAFPTVFFVDQTHASVPGSVPYLLNNGGINGGLSIVDNTVATNIDSLVINQTLIIEKLTKHWAFSQPSYSPEISNAYFASGVTYYGFNDNNYVLVPIDNRTIVITINIINGLCYSYNSITKKYQRLKDFPGIFNYTSAPAQNGVGEYHASLAWLVVPLNYYYPDPNNTRKFILFSEHSLGFYSFEYDYDTNDWTIQYPKRLPPSSNRRFAGYPEDRYPPPNPNPYNPPEVLNWRNYIINGTRYLFASRIRFNTPGNPQIEIHDKAYLVETNKFLPEINQLVVLPGAAYPDGPLYTIFAGNNRLWEQFYYRPWGTYTSKNNKIYQISVDDPWNVFIYAIDLFATIPVKMVAQLPFNGTLNVNYGCFVDFFDNLLIVRYSNGDVYKFDTNSESIKLVGNVGPLPSLARILLLKGGISIATPFTNSVTITTKIGQNVIGGGNEAVDFGDPTNDHSLATKRYVDNQIANSTLVLGTTSTTAFRGDWGLIAYNHSQIITGNPHGTTKYDIGLGNVDNTSDLDKPISIATQNALDAIIQQLSTIQYLSLFD